MKDAVLRGKISGDGYYTRQVHAFFSKHYQFQKCLMTTSCTDALEMCAILLDIMPGDEVILPSYTFVSTANPFILRGAKLIFADSKESNPNIDEHQIESLITPKTKAIVVVHYAGIACDMDVVMEIANKYGLYVVEDAAQAINSFYKGRPLGSFGNLAAFSFHETKNIISGEGGMLVVNDSKFNNRAEIIREKGTNRSQFFRGEVDKYSWIDIGSSFLPSDMICAFLYSQLENLDRIQERRIEIWNKYYDGLFELVNTRQIKLPHIDDYAVNNAHMFYIICKSLDERDRLIAFLKSKNISTVFHYLSLHSSQFYRDKHDGRVLKNSDYYSDCLLRLPFYYELTHEDQNSVIQEIVKFYNHV